MFVPYWIFTTRVRTHWTADTSQTPPGARADWFPIAGHRRARLRRPLGARPARADRPGELDRRRPVRRSAGACPRQVDLDDVTVEQFSVSRRYARPLAQGRLEALEAEAVAAEVVPGGRRNVHVNVLMEGADVAAGAGAGLRHGLSLSRPASTGSS